jgi:excisionase family DNA binding protein
MTDDFDNDPWMSTVEIAEYLGIHPSTVRTWVSSGRLRGVRIGARKWRVRRSELARMMRSGHSSLMYLPVNGDPYQPPTLRPGDRMIAFARPVPPPR